jgi:hypothetical protein
MEVVSNPFSILMESVTIWHKENVFIKRIPMDLQGRGRRNSMKQRLPAETE